VRPGITSADVCAAAEEKMRELGYENRRRRTMDRISVEKGSMIGHGMGFNHHELPFICPADHTRWEEGMVVAVEIGLGEEEYGFSDLEDNFLVTADGCERLTPVERNLWQDQPG
jgi:Xaa-Pro aminopeptidase